MMDLQFQILLDVSPGPFALSIPQVRLALERMHPGEVLKLRARSERDGSCIQDIARRAECHVVCSGMHEYYYECLIRKA